MAKCNTEKLTAAFLGIVLALSVFTEGMYREGGRYIFWFVTAAVFVFAVFKLKINIRPESPADWLLIAASAVYILCSITAVSPWDSISNIFRYIGIYLFCLLARRTVKENFCCFAFPLFFISAVSALWGIIDSLNIIRIGGAYDQAKGLLLSVFHYHNASAIYFSCMFILGLYIVSVTDKKLLKAAVFGCNSLFISTVLYTQSRGCWFVLTAGVILFLVLNRKSDKFSEYIYSVIIPVLSAAAVMNGFMSAFSSRTGEFVCEKPGLCIFFVVLGICIAAALSFLSGIKLWKKLFIPKHILAASPVIIVLGVLAVIFVMPAELTNRIKEFSLSSATVTERAVFLKDAFKIFKQHPILGIGGDAWQYVYPSVQTQFYTVAHPHSYFAEMMTDAGIFGILLYAFLIFNFIFNINKSKKTSVSVSLITVSFMIMLHTLFDFDTDYYTIQTLLFVAIFLTSPERETRKSYSKLAIVFPAVLLVWAALNGVAYLNYNHAVKTATADNAKEVYTYTKRAVTLMPIKVDYLVTHANVTLGRSGGEQKYLYEAKNCLDRAYSLNEYNYETITQLAIYKIRTGDYDGACDTIDTLVDLQPFIPETYMRIKAVYYDYMIVPLSSQLTEENAQFLKTLCRRFVNSVNRAYPIFEKNHARIEIFWDVKDARQAAEDIIKQLDDMGV